MLATISLLASVTLAAASPLRRTVNPSGGFNTSESYSCTQFYHTIQASAMNIDLSFIGKPANQIELVQANINMSEAGSTVAASVMAAPKVSTSGSYNMWFEYCEPNGGPTKSSILQTLHGLVGNAAYWNVVIQGNDTLSFAAAAAKAGYATLSYDRLCVGKSAKPDGTSVCQITYEAAQAVAISQALKDGSLGVGTWKSVIGVGHSYGSATLSVVASTAPSAFDALALTGFSANATSGPLGLAGFSSTLATIVSPLRFYNESTDYWATPSVSADQLSFFHYPDFTIDALNMFTSTKGEYTQGQVLTLAAPYSLTRPNYTAPLIVVTGQYDGPYCAGNCSVTSLTGTNVSQVNTALSIYPGVSAGNKTTYLVPGSAHGINFHNTAPLAYQAIFSFLSSHRL